MRSSKRRIRLRVTQPFSNNTAALAPPVLELPLKVQANVEAATVAVSNDKRPARLALEAVRPVAAGALRRVC